MLGDRLVLKAKKLCLQKRPNYKTAYELLLRAMQLEHPEAIYAIGTWYLFGGRIVKRNKPKAFELISKAAESKYPEACYTLAVFYEKGDVVKKSNKKAFKLYMKAALFGYGQSFREVGRCYYWGIDTPKNRALADIWLDKAEALGIYK